MLSNGFLVKNLVYSNDEQIITLLQRKTRKVQTCIAEFISSSYSFSRWLTLTCRRTLNWYTPSSSESPDDDESSVEPLASDSVPVAFASTGWLAWESIMMFEKLMSTNSKRFLRRSSLAFFLTFLSKVMRNFCKLVMSLFCKRKVNNWNERLLTMEVRAHQWCCLNWSELRSFLEFDLKNLIQIWIHSKLRRNSKFWRQFLTTETKYKFLHADRADKTNPLQEYSELVV